MLNTISFPCIMYIFCQNTLLEIVIVPAGDCTVQVLQISNDLCDTDHVYRKTSTKIRSSQ